MCVCVCAHTQTEGVIPLQLPATFWWSFLIYSNIKMLLPAFAFLFYVSSSLHEERLWLIIATDTAEDSVLVCVERRITETVICASCISMIRSQIAHHTFPGKFFVLKMKEHENWTAVLKKLAQESKNWTRQKCLLYSNGTIPNVDVCQQQHWVDWFEQFHENSNDILWHFILWAHVYIITIFLMRLNEIKLNCNKRQKWNLTAP